MESGARLNSGKPGPMEIRAEMARTEVNYKKSAASLLAACRSFYLDPENEKAFQEYKKKGGRT